MEELNIIEAKLSSVVHLLSTNQRSRVGISFQDTNAYGCCGVHANKKC